MAKRIINHKKKLITNKRERVILSEILPYELPVTFSNRHLYNFLIKNKIEIKKGIIKFDQNNGALKHIIKLLFGLQKDYCFQSIPNKTYKTVPFNYKILHKEADFRELSIIHPLNQLVLIDFYEKYKEMIIYYCNISPFSIRKPSKVAKFIYYKDKTHRESLDNEHKIVEKYGNEYESLRSFFVYKDYSNIYKFYESYRYHRCEKKYDKLFKFDIARCFDSIYTHSISWSLLNKAIVKDNINKSINTFGGYFDNFMQNHNYGETNGIIIGPEFSRLFAEVILQKIDIIVFGLLKAKKYTHKRDYEIFRYIDDFFIFYNDENIKDDIVKIYKIQLTDYNFYLNESKNKMFDRPIITEITIVKQQISDLLNNNFNFKTTEKLKTDIDADLEAEDNIVSEYSFYINSNNLISRFKAIIKTANIDSKEILNYTFSIIDRKVLKLIENYIKIEDIRKYESKITKAIIEILDYIFFLYSASPRVSFTIKLCSILNNIIVFSLKRGKLNFDNKHLITKKIYDEISLILSKSVFSEYTQVETLYLLITLRELGKEYRIDEIVLCEYFNIDFNKPNYKNLNYLSITVLLFYIAEKVRYNKTREFLKDCIKQKFEEVSKDNRLKTTELTLLLFDLLVCPYLDQSYKKELLSFYGIEQFQPEIINKENYWFTQWTNFKFGKELDAKKSKEVY
ncbi:MAG: RNA-directed DNA polymerase [Nitrospirae bacterium]|nr:RNA-directed DNA polymerase [Nitrospirota bacterium]